MTISPVAVVFNYQQTGKYALNVIAGSIMTQQKLRDIPIYFAKNRAELKSQLVHAKQRAHKVVVAWSFYSPQFFNIKTELADITTNITEPSIIHLAGGVHASAEPLQTLRAGFQYVAIGEGEKIITDFLSALVMGGDPKSVRGIAYLDGTVLVKNGRGKTINLNDYPPYASRFRKFGPIEITRGCIYACKFCQTPYFNKAIFRHRTIENICHYVRIMTACGLRDYRFLTPTSMSYGSDNETVNIDAIEFLLSSVRSIVGKHRRIFYGTFPSEIRPEHVTLKHLTVLKKYVDNDNIIIGGQSGSQTVLNASSRGHSVESIINAVKVSLKAGFRPNVDFLFGLPGESLHDAQMTINLANVLTQLGAKIHNHTFMPLPGTPFRHEAAGFIQLPIFNQICSLTAQGKAYGKWKQQQNIAKQLEKLHNKN